MKNIKYFLVVAVAVLGLAACEDGIGGAGDAKVSFDKTNYEFKENSGTVTIPFNFTGEPEKYPIMLNVSATVEGGVELNSVVRFVQQIGSLRYNGNGELAIDIEIVDNFKQNPDRTVILEIMSAEGAEIVGGRTEITIKDNDGKLFDSLQGKWKFYSMRDNEEPVYFEVAIDGGETKAEQEENKNNDRLRVLGFAGYYYVNEETGSGPFQWYLDIVQDENGEYSLKTVSNPNVLIGDAGDVIIENDDVDPEIYRNCSIVMWSQPVNSSDLSMEFDIAATISDDGTTITFDRNWTILPYFFRRTADGLEPYSPSWGQFFNCYMIRM